MSRRRVPPTARRGDVGFTLIEVVVALVLLGVVASASLGFFVSGARDTAHMQRRQAAVAAGNQAMELVKSVVATNDWSGVSTVVKGRRQADVTAQWARVDSADEDAAYPAWDPDSSLTSSAAAVLSLQSTVTVGSVDYGIETLLGRCYRPKADLTAGCGRVGEVAPSATPVGYVAMFRAIIVVSWSSPQSGGCDSDRCTYELSSLVDPNGDPTWNTGTVPVATDDSIQVRAGQTIVIDVLANDDVVAGSSPTQITAHPQHGTATPTANGSVTYTPQSGWDGDDVFTYTVRDAAGQISNVASVRIKVTPL